MKKWFVLALLFASCTQQEGRFCDCMEAGEILNEETAKIMNSGEASEKDEKNIQALKDEKKKLCKEFETLDGETMRELKKSCAED